jgi:hypothetical protein
MIWVMAFGVPTSLLLRNDGDGEQTIASTFTPTVVPRKCFGMSDEMLQAADLKQIA